jgi:peptidyl-prolyl cis-trans isomerase C
MTIFKSNYLTQVAVAIFCLTSFFAIAAEDDVKTTLAKPYVTVNGKTQTNARAEILLREQLARGVADSQALRASVRDTLINLALMEQQAQDSFLDKEVLVEAQIELARQNILAQAWQQKVLSETTVSNAVIQSEYALQISRMGTQEFLLRHLLVSEESTAKLLIEKLQSGSKMADLAKEYSRDVSTQNRGGLTDWANPSNLMPAVAQAVAKLSKGKFSLQPVHSELGWHILQLEDTRSLKAPSLEDIKIQLSQIVGRRLIDARLKPLRDRAKVQ